MIERTHDACKGLVDIVIDFGTTSRSLHRSLQCLSEGGVVLISEDTAEKLLPKFHRRAEERKQHIEPVPVGTIEQLKDLVQLVANGDVSLSTFSNVKMILKLFPFQICRLNHRRIQFSHARKPQKSFVNSFTLKFPDVQSSSSMTSNKLNDNYGASISEHFFFVF